MNIEVLNDRSTDVGGHHRETVMGNQKILVRQNQSETVSVAKALTVGAGYVVTVGAAMNTAVTLSQTEEVGVDKTTFVGNRHELLTGDLIEIRCGKSLIRMDKSGKIEIRGTDVIIDSYESHGVKRKSGHNLRFHFTDDEGVPYADTSYTAHRPDGTEEKGRTDKEGYTETFHADESEEITVHLDL